MKHLLDLTELNQKELIYLLDLADSLKSELKNDVCRDDLRHKTLAMIFTKSSTRTRVSFSVAMHQLGGQALFLSDSDIQLGRGESISDTAGVLSRMVDAVMIRTHLHQDVLDLARHSAVPVINGLSDLAHPCQILADLQTIRAHKNRLQGLKIAYVGDGNNVANSLLIGCALAGLKVAVATPPLYGCCEQVVARARDLAVQNGGQVLVTDDPALAAEDADVIYTDTWISMGDEEESEERVKIFQPFQVNKELMAKAAPGAIFMHCLPAYRGLEVTPDVIDGPSSVIFEQAENRLHAQKALLLHLIGQTP